MTKSSETPRIRYDEGCLAAHALNVMGDRWALLVVRELMFAPKRFQAIRAGLPGITAGVLTQRLQQLADAGVVIHDARLGFYALGASGHELMPVLQAMCRWGAQHPGHDPRRFISPAALAISMTAMIDRAAARDLTLSAGLRSGAEGFLLCLGGDAVLRAEAAVDPDENASFVLEGSGNQLARAVYGPTPLVALRDEGVISVTGDLAAARGFVDLFRLR